MAALKKAQRCENCGSTGGVRLIPDWWKNQPPGKSAARICRRCVARVGYEERKKQIQEALLRREKVEKVVDNEIVIVEKPIDDVIETVRQVRNQKSVDEAMIRPGFGGAAPSGPPNVGGSVTITGGLGGTQPGPFSLEPLYSRGEPGDLGPRVEPRVERVSEVPAEPEPSRDRNPYASDLDLEEE